MELLEQNPIRCWHVLGPPSLHVAKAGNTPNPSLIVIGQLGVLVFVDGQIFVEQELSQHLNRSSQPWTDDKLPPHTTDGVGYGVLFMRLASCWLGLDKTSPWGIQYSWMFCKAPWWRRLLVQATKPLEDVGKGVPKTGGKWEELGWQQACLLEWWVRDMLRLLRGVMTLTNPMP